MFLILQSRNHQHLLFSLPCIFSEEVFSAYRHREILPGCLPHPGDIVEAGPLAVSVWGVDMVNRGENLLAAR